VLAATATRRIARTTVCGATAKSIATTPRINARPKRAELRRR
jgi:hypothetical protein